MKAQATAHHLSQIEDPAVQDNISDIAYEQALWTLTKDTAGPASDAAEACATEIAVLAVEAALLRRPANPGVFAARFAINLAERLKPTQQPISPAVRSRLLADVFGRDPVNVTASQQIPQVSDNTILVEIAPRCFISLTPLPGQTPFDHIPQNIEEWMSEPTIPITPEATPAPAAIKSPKFARPKLEPAQVWMCHIVEGQFTLTLPDGEHTWQLVSRENMPRRMNGIARLHPEFLNVVEVHTYAAGGGGVLNARGLAVEI